MDERKNRNQQEMPDYFGTGRRPQREGPRTSLILILLLVLLGANLVTVGIFLGRRQAMEGQGETQEGGRELISSLKNLLPGREATASAPVMEESLSSEEVYDQVSQTLTRVVAQAPGYAQTGLGVILSSDGYILTNAHVIEDADALSVTLYDGREKTALYVGADPQTDLAVLKIEEENLLSAMPGSITSSDVLYTISAPEEDALTEATFEQATRKGFLGAVVNQWGQVISFGREDSAPISMQDAEAVAEELIRYGCVSRKDCLGLQISDLDQVEQRYWALPQGILVDQAAVNGSGYRAGLRAGDLITKVGDRQISNVEEFRQAVEDSGDSVSVEFYRKGQEYRVEVTP